MSSAITLPQTLIKRLEKISTGTRHTPESIVKQAVKDRLDYEEWKLEQIDAGLADIKAGRVITHEEMVARMERKIGVTGARKKTA